MQESPAAIWIYHPDGRNSFERISESDAHAKGWALIPDFSDLEQLSILAPAPPAEMPAERKTEKIYTCDICGKEVSSPLALSGHKRSHK